MSDYYLAVTGLAGTSVARGYEGTFLVAGFDFSIDHAVGGIGGGGAVQSPPQITFVFADEAGLAGFLDAMEHGAPLDGMTLSGVDRLPNGSAVRDYQLKLGAVTVTQVHDDSGDGFSVTVTPKAFELTTTPIGPTGAPGAPQVTSWSDGPVKTLGATAPGKALGVVPADKYFLVIDGLRGDSTTLGHEGAFELQGFDFGGTGGVSSGGQVGKPTFDALSLNFFSSTDIGKVMAAFAGQSVLNMRIEGVSLSGGKPETVYRLDLGGAEVKSLEEVLGHGTPGLQLSVNVTAFKLETSEIGKGGGPVSNGTDTWDVVHGGDSVPTISAVAGKAAAAARPVDLAYLTIDLGGGPVSGASKVVGHEGQIEVLSPQLNLGGDAPTLTFAVRDLATLPAFMRGLTSTQAQLTLQGVDQTDTGVAKAQTINASDAEIVSVSSVETSPGGDAFFVVTMALGSTRVTTFDANGTKVDDVAIGPNGAKLTDMGLPSSTQGAVLPTALYLALKDKVGDSLATGHEKWFSLQSVEFGGQKTVAAVAGGGLSASLPDYSVKLTFNSLDALTHFVGAQNSGKAQDLSIDGVRDSNNTSHTTFELDLGGALVTRIEQGNDGFSVELAFQGLALKTTPINGDGKAQPPSQFAWDAGQHIPTFSVPAVTPGTGAYGASVHATEFYLAVPGLHGDSVVQGLEGDLRIDSVQLGASSTVEITATEPRISKPVTEPVTVHVSDNVGLAAFLNKMNAGGNFSAITLTGVTNNGTLRQTTTQTFSQVLIEDVRQDADGLGYTIAFRFSSEQFTTRSFDPTGLVSTSTTGPTITPVAAPGGPVNPTTPVKFFMLVDGMNGGSAAQGHEGWFEIQGFDFDGGVAITSTTGGLSAGKPTYDQVEVSLTGLSGLTGLLTRLTTGGAISGVRIEGVDASGRAVYDLNLVQVSVGKVQQGSDGTPVVSLAYSGFQVKTFSLDKGGLPINPETASWNLATGTNSVNLPNISPGTLPPGAPISLSLDAAADSGLVGDGLTNAQTVLIDGFAQAGATIKLFDNGTEVGSGAANGSGVFQVSLATLGDGTHSLTATATVGGLTSVASDGISVTVDRTAPTAPTGLTLDPTPAADPHALAIDGKAEAGSKVTIFDGATQVATATADANGNFRATTSVLTSGVHTLTATARDAAGNTGSAGSLTVNLTDVATVAGGAADDVIAGSDANQKLTGGGGNDTLSGGAGNDTLSGDAGNDLVLGGTGADSVLGSDGNDTVDGGAGADVLSGGRGTDVFVFGAGYGSDMIIDFRQVDHDQIRLVGLGATSFSDVTSHAAQVGSNVVITFGTDVLQINGIQLASLTASDFLFG